MGGAKDYMRDFDRLMDAAEEKTLPTEAEILKFLKGLNKPYTPENRKWAASLIRSNRQTPTDEIDF